MARYCSAAYKTTFCDIDPLLALTKSITRSQNGSSPFLAASTMPRTWTWWYNLYVPFSVQSLVPPRGRWVMDKFYDIKIRSVMSFHRLPGTAYASVA